MQFFQTYKTLSGNASRDLLVRIGISPLILFPFIWILGLYPCIILAQNNLSFETFRSENGLSQNTINCLLQDRTGFLWVGTMDGLNRYDGREFKVYRTGKSDTTSLTDNHIISMVESRDGSIWVGTRFGLNRYDPKTGSFRQYVMPTDSTGKTSSNYIHSIAEGPDGDIWFGTYHGLFRMNPENARFTHFQADQNDPQSLTGNTVWALKFDRTGNLWIGTKNGISLMAPFKGDRKPSFASYVHDPEDPNSISDNYVWAFFEDEDGNMWTGGWLGIQRAKTNAGGHLSFERFIHHPKDPHSLSHNFINSMLIRDAKL